MDADRATLAEENAALKAELAVARASPQNIRIFVGATTVSSSDGHSKLLASLLLARDWFTENNPEGAAFEYEILD